MKKISLTFSREGKRYIGFLNQNRKPWSDPNAVP